MILNSVQARVLGSLIEKEITTPETYPLSLNALVNACNQRSSREPVMDLDEEEVRQALHGLEEWAMVSAVRDSRVVKYEHHARTVLNLRRDETAVVCLLLLRGPQTPGELRARADRLYAFDGLEAVEGTLQRLASRAAETAGSSADGALTILLPRQPGSRESRWAHLLSGSPETGAQLPETASRPIPKAGGVVESSVGERLAAVEAELARLAGVVARLQSKSN